METKKKDELTEKELEQVTGGVTRREIACNPRLRKRAADHMFGTPPEKPEQDDFEAKRMVKK